MGRDIDDFNTRELERALRKRKGKSVVNPIDIFQVILVMVLFTATHFGPLPALVPFAVGFLVIMLLGWRITSYCIAVADRQHRIESILLEIVERP